MEAAYLKICRLNDGRMGSAHNAADAMIEYAVGKAKAGEPKRP